MKISLVIPTRERSRFLRESVATAVASDDADVEILVSDNASEDDTRAVVQSFADPRIRYVDTGRRVSMRQNFENAIEESSGDYIVMVGDDDGFLAGQIRFLKRILAKHEPDALSWKIPTYGWPNDTHANRVAGVRFMKTGLFHLPVKPDIGELRDHLAKAKLGDIAEQPALYHGCVARKYLESTRSKSGDIINGKIPDVYFNFSAIIRGGNFLHTGHPFSINGYSLSSTGGATHAYKTNDARSNPAKRFAQEAQTDPVQDVIPEFVKSIPFVLFSTLETVRREIDAGDFPVEYKHWYRYVLAHAGSAEEEVRAQVRALLSAYSERTGTDADYRDALSAGSGITRKAGRLLRKMERIASFKLSAANDGQNTILTAAKLIDDVLADDFGDVLDGSMSSNRAWLRAMGRGLRHKLGR